MDRTNFVDGPILPASWLNRLQDKAERALEDQSKALLAGEIVAGLDLTVAASTATISAGLAYDHQGRPIPAAQALTLSLADLDRTTSTNWLWAAVWVRATVHRSGSVHDLDNVAHDLYLDDAAEAGIDLGASAATKQTAVRPPLAAGKVLVADLAVDAATPWADLAIDLSRRTALTRDAGAIDRALTALQAAVIALQTSVAQIKTSIPGQPDLSGLVTSVQLAALTSIVNAVKATADAAVTQAQLAAATPQATTTVRGLVELAADAEVLTGTDAERAVTPRSLAARTATEARSGIVRLASESEVQETAAPSGTDFARVPSIGRLRASLTATAARKGLVELATSPEARSGTDTERAVTPAGMRAHGDARYRHAVLSETPSLGVVNLSEPVANFRWIRAITQDGIARDCPVPLGNAWRSETVMLQHRSNVLSALNMTTGSRTQITRTDGRTMGNGMARIGGKLYGVNYGKIMVLNLDDPRLTIATLKAMPEIQSTDTAMTAVNGLLYFVGYTSGGRKLWSINPATRAVTEIGRINFGRSASGRGIGMAAIGTTVYISTRDRVHTLDLATARTTPLPNPAGVRAGSVTVGVGMTAIGNTLYLSAGGLLYTVDTRTGRATRVEPDGISWGTHAPALAPGPLPAPGTKFFADGARSVVCRVPGASQIVGVR